MNTSEMMARRRRLLGPNVRLFYDAPVHLVRGEGSWVWDSAGRRYLDGGISDRPGILAATPGARVLYHHLPPNSPWRRFTPTQNHPPKRSKLHVLSEPALPRLSPFHLLRGAAAYTLAKDMTQRALNQTLDERPEAERNCF